MRGIETVNPFPSAAHSVDELYVNYRSTGAITDFTRKVFQQRLCDIEEYSRAARETGLSDYRQTVKRGRENEGYVETWLLERNENEPPEKEKINEVIDSVLARGYSYSDIAILTSKNDDVVRVTTWLNEKQIPFLSYSSLDIRRRKITGEILALLAFLDSPPDDLCFATFILGDIFRACCTGRDRTMEIEGLRTLCFKNRRRRDRPLYKAFQEEMGELWEQYFGTLFRLSGYLPLYDLIVEAYKTFEVFRLFGPGEEAALTRILEVVKDLEAKGGSSLRRFLDAAGVPQDDEVDWNIDAPSGIAAVKVMTIHKAKGLGFPVVVLLLYGEKNRGFRYIIQQDGDSAALLRLTKPMLHVCNDFAVRYAEEEMRERVNQINTLYVALTRASAELHVVGVRGEKEFFPFALFPSGRSGVPSESIECREKVSGRAAAYYHTTPLIGSSAGEGALRFKEKQRGDLAHKILSFIIFNDAGFEKELDEISQEVCGKAGEGDQAYDLADMLYNFLRSDPARRYFERRPGRTVLVEQEFADAGGRLFRMDRVVLDSDRVTVLEYKTGGEGGEEEKHFAQMGNYLAILGQVFPGKDMEGLICYLDFGTVRHLYSGG
jgi:ATP-dependent exoDNAse (exonuclease V) beta subunit